MPATYALSTLNTPLSDAAIPVEQALELREELRTAIIRKAFETRSYDDRVHQLVHHVRATRYLYPDPQPGFADKALAIVVTPDGECFSKSAPRHADSWERAKRIRYKLAAKDIYVAPDLPPARCEAEIAFRPDAPTRSKALRFVGKCADAVLGGKALPSAPDLEFSPHEQLFLTDAQVDPDSPAVRDEALHKSYGTVAAGVLDWAVRARPADFCDRLEEVQSTRWWAVDTARQNQREQLDLLSQHRALSWLLTPGVGWDDVDMST